MGEWGEWGIEGVRGVYLFASYVLSDSYTSFGICFEYIYVFIFYVSLRIFPLRTRFYVFSRFLYILRISNIYVFIRLRIFTLSDFYVYLRFSASCVFYVYIYLLNVHYVHYKHLRKLHPLKEVFLPYD